MTESEPDVTARTLAGHIADLIVRELPCIARWRDTFAGITAECDASNQALVNISVTPWDLDSVAEPGRDPIQITARVEIRALARQERQSAAISAGRHEG